MRKEVNDFINCYKSLGQACDFAGGKAPEIIDLDDMTAADLIDLISVNKIEFIYTGNKGMRSEP